MTQSPCRILSFCMRCLWAQTIRPWDPWLPSRHVEQQPDARGQRLEEPDVGDRRRQLDVAHALAPHARERHLDRALLADDALVLHALVLAAQALVVLDRTEDA